MSQYKPGDLVYLISAQTTLLKTSSRKFRVINIRSLVVYKIIDKIQYMDIEGKILNDIFPFKRLKQAF